MPVLIGELEKITGSPSSVTQVMVRAHETRITGSALTTDELVPIPVDRQGRFEVPLRPGKAVLVLVHGGRVGEGERFPMLVEEGLGTIVSAIKLASDRFDDYELDELERAAADMLASLDRGLVAATRAEVAKEGADKAKSDAEKARDKSGEHRDDAKKAAGTAAAEAVTMFLNSAEDTLDPLYVREDDRTVHVKHFGAVGDGVEDDTAALQSAIRSGAPLYWGTSEDTYRITDSLIRYRSDTGDVVWISDGAVIFCDAPSPVRRAVWLNSEGADVTIQGPLTIDANKTAFIGFCLDNNQGDRADCHISHLTALNVHRSSNEHVGGDGIMVRGGWNTLVLDHPIVRNVTMAAGVYDMDNFENGVSGISIMAFNHQRSPESIYISNMIVDGVYDEDTNSYDSQNGVRIFGPAYVDGISTPSDVTFKIVGGLIRNCGGRSVKVQCEWGSIYGLMIRRDQDRRRGKAEIDFQRGGGQVTDLSVQYEGNSSSDIVKFTGPNVSGMSAGHGSVKGLKALIVGDQVPDTIVDFLQENEQISWVSIADVEIVGEQPPNIVTLNGISGTITHAAVSGVFAAPTSALIRGAGGQPDGWSGSVAVTNCANTGEEVPLFEAASQELAAPTLSFSHITGFGVDDSIDADRAVVVTTLSTTSGWNNLQIESGFGEVYTPSYYRPPEGGYRVTYVRASNAPFDRTWRSTSSDESGRETITPVNGMAEENLYFDGSHYLRVAGEFSDLTIVLERISKPPTE